MSFLFFCLYFDRSRQALFEVMSSQSAHIRACKTATSTDKMPVLHHLQHKLWCTCGGYDDGCLMLCCDKQAVDCCIWYYYDSLGMSLPDTVV